MVRQKELHQIFGDKAVGLDRLESLDLNLYANIFRL